MLENNIHRLEKYVRCKPDIANMRYPHLEISIITHYCCFKHIIKYNCNLSLLHGNDTTLELVKIVEKTMKEILKTAKLKDLLKAILL